MWKADRFLLLDECKLIDLGASSEVLEHAHPWVMKDREGVDLPL